MNVIALENVSKDFGVKPLFQNISIGLGEGEKVGLIGANGAGKTTFLRVLAKLDLPDSGNIVHTSDKKIEYLAQNPQFDENKTVIETVFDAQSRTFELLREYENLCHQLAENSGDNENLLSEVAEKQSELENLGAWEIETNARSVLQKLGLNDSHARIGTLSGGQRKRVALAHALINKPDVLILDEPTNHLDADTIEWLEGFLGHFGGTLLLVTHDRYFLDRVTDKIWEIENGNVQVFQGNYAYYLEKKSEQENLRETEAHKREQLIKKELAWLRRGAKARTRKSKARIDAAHELMAQPKFRAKDEIDISVTSSRLGSKIIELEHIQKSYGEKRLISDFSYTFAKNDRIGIIGANGAGKTTLLEIISERITPDAGKIEIGQTVRIGYYDQESRALKDDQRVIDYVRDIAEYLETADGSRITASQMLEKFLFSRDAQYAPIGKLSGGERRRLYLLKVLMTVPNVLLLDEPTNDLDIETLVALENYLDDFRGVLICVSHDRYFLDRTIDRVFRIENGGEIRQFAGDYSFYLETRQSEANAENALVREQKQAEDVKLKEAEKQFAAPRKLSFKEKREFEDLEKNIAASENRLKLIERELGEFAADAYKVNQLFSEQQALQNELEKAFERWSELAERAEI